MVKEVLIAGVTGLALVGCAAETPPTSPNIPIVQEALSKTAHYWATQGLGNISTINMVTLEGRGDAFVCHGDSDPASKAHTLRARTLDVIAEYCVVENSIVVIKANYTSAEKTTALTPAQYALKEMAHETGHAVLTARNEVPQDAVLNELRAECYGAQAVSQLDPAAVPLIIQDIRKNFGGSASHGTQDQRVDAFQQGADPQGVPCGNYVIR